MPLARAVWLASAAAVASQARRPRHRVDVVIQLLLADGLRLLGIRYAAKQFYKPFKT